MKETSSLPPPPKDPSLVMSSSEMIKQSSTSKDPTETAAISDKVITSTTSQNSNALLTPGKRIYNSNPKKQKNLCFRFGKTELVFFLVSSSADSISIMKNFVSSNTTPPSSTQVTPQKNKFAKVLNFKNSNSENKTF